MRIIKEADVRKNEILDAANELFNRKGFDGTSISDILEKVGIARGTLYYHFKSKEEIMDALIERYSATLLSAVKEVAENKSIPVFERLFKAIMAMNISKEDTKILEHMHKPQNALLHQKSHQAVLEGIPPILLEVVEDGIKEGLFETPYPYECIEMAITYTNMVFDNNSGNPSEEEMLRKMNAFLFNAERLLGAKTGSFLPLMEHMEAMMIFHKDGGNEE